MKSLVKINTKKGNLFVFNCQNCKTVDANLLETISTFPLARVTDEIVIKLHN